MNANRVSSELSHVTASQTVSIGLEVDQVSHHWPIVAERRGEHETVPDRVLVWPALINVKYKAHHIHCAAGCHPQQRRPVVCKALH